MSLNNLSRKKNWICEKYSKTKEWKTEGPGGFNHIVPKALYFYVCFQAYFKFGYIRFSKGLQFLAGLIRAL